MWLIDNLTTQLDDLTSSWDLINRLRRLSRSNTNRARCGLFDAHGATFTCAECNTPNQPFHDIPDYGQSWRHLDFFPYKSYIHAPHPRVLCSVCHQIKFALVPWSRVKCRFTRDFEKFVLTLVQDMPVNALARIVREHDTRLWRIVHFHVNQALAKQDLSNLQRVAVDEISSRRGHKYVTVFLDSDEHKVVFATEGKDKSTIDAFKNHLLTHGGNPEQITEYCSDMSQAFMSRMTADFPKATQTVDKFHVMKMVNEAVDDVRREEQHEQPELKKTRYLWLKNQSVLSPEQQQRVTALSQMNLKTGRAYRLKLAFQDLWVQPRLVADLYLHEWYQWATRSRIPQMIEVARTIQSMKRVFCIGL